MTRPVKPPRPHFTVFHSAAAEIECASARDKPVAAGTHSHAKSGRVVQLSPGNLKVVLLHEDGLATEHACASMQQGEALIRRNTPSPPTRDRSRDRDERPS